MRTVTLEILRNGPANNQLLSPFTPYLVLCGNMPASTLSLPFAHQEYLLRLRSLQYRESNDARSLELAESARKMGDVLGSIPALIRELKECEESGEAVVHLRLILSPNELALLPFELSDSPPGCPGAGRPLVLQSQTLISLTREVRRVVSRQVSPIPIEGQPPKILFAAASPPGVGPIPLKAHLLALRQAIDPWLWSFLNDDERREQVAKHLTVLPEASLAEIEQACATGTYTHIHILAHGIEIEQPAGPRFALALHSSLEPNGIDPVQGDRLAAALRTHVRMHDGDFARPLVVSLAACNAGDVGSVVGAAASIAHDLHHEGIPFVVASQFPLSFAGSVVLAEELFRELLWGSDPRLMLVELRRTLKTTVKDTHDWGSVVSYVSLPPALDEQLSRFRLQRAYEALVAAVNHFDRAVQLWVPDAFKPQKKGAEGNPLEAQSRKLEDQGRKKLGRVRARLEHLLETSSADRLNGLLASAEKRLAVALWRLESYRTGEKRAENRSDIETSLERSRRFYRAAFEADQSQSWGLVQALALDAVLGKVEPQWREDWHLARLISERSLREEDREHRAWAYSSLLELNILALASRSPKPLQSEALSRKSALLNAEKLIEVADPKKYEVHSTRQQLGRYPFFNVFASERGENAPLSKCLELARAVWKLLDSTSRSDSPR